ncbi:MAG: hypothetical protein HY063_07460 [Bacteroidetes bacterium]|nr:hypothetical protein [Bacteroidota bacterium]
MKKNILLIIAAASAASLFAQTMTTSEYNKLQEQERAFKLNGGMNTLLRYEQEAQYPNTYREESAIKKLKQENLQLKAELKLLKEEIETLKKKQ